MDRRAVERGLFADTKSIGLNIAQAFAEQG